MRITTTLAVLSAVTLGFGGAAAQQSYDSEPLEARVWLDRGDEPVLQRGDRVRVYYRTSRDAYVAIFRIDTDGRVALLHPRNPEDAHYIRGGRDYRLLFPRSPYWYVDEYPGMGYYFVVASPEPFDFSWLGYAQPAGWDLSGVGGRVYEDPYLAIDDYVARLIPDWETAPYALDFIAYNVGESHDYPRFLCYDCHGYRQYQVWNPYRYACSTFRVVIWDDPYYYPGTRYRGTRVVFSTPLRNRPRYEFKERSQDEGWSPLVRRRPAPDRRTVEYREPEVAPRPGMGGTIQRRPPTVRSTDPGAAGRGAPSSALQRRDTDDRDGTARSPSGPRLLRTPDQLRREQDEGTATGRATTPGRGERPVLNRRSPASSSGGARPEERRPSGTLRLPPRPPVDVRSGGGAAGSARSGTPSRPTRVVRPPSSGRSGAASRPSLPSRPSVNPGSSGSRPPVVKRPPPQRRPVVRPRTKPKGGGAARRPPPPKKKRGGGGNGNGGG